MWLVRDMIMQSQFNAAAWLLQVALLPHAPSSITLHHSLDSAQERAAAAEARVRDYGEDAAAPIDAAGPSVLPSPLAVFDEVTGPPPFLDPEATRPLARAAMHGRASTSAAAFAAVEATDQPGGRGSIGRPPSGADFDIALLAPKLKGKQEQ